MLEANPLACSTGDTTIRMVKAPAQAPEQRRLAGGR
jgi:hypothetical protein